jgi:hypothetical protein
LTLPSGSVAAFGARVNCSYPFVAAIKAALAAGKGIMLVNEGGLVAGRASAARDKQLWPIRHTLGQKDFPVEKVVHGHNESLEEP